MKQLLLYLSLFCSCAVIAQEQKYILLDSLTTHYQVKQYTLDTSPYGVKNTIEIYNVFSPYYGTNKGIDYIILFSVLPDLSSKTNWEEINFKKIRNNLFSVKNIFMRVEHKVFNVPLEKAFDISNTILIKKVKNKYYASKNTWIEDFYCMDYPRDMQVATKNFILNTNQPIKPMNILKENYKKVVPFLAFPLDEDDLGFLIPDILESTYLSNIEDKLGNKIYYFYQFCNARYIGELAYIKDKGIVAGAYYDYFYTKGKRDSWDGDWAKLTHDGKRHLLWAEELKKEWAEKEKAKK